MFTLQFGTLVGLYEGVIVVDLQIVVGVVDLYDVGASVVAITLGGKEDTVATGTTLGKVVVAVLSFIGNVVFGVCFVE